MSFALNRIFAVVISCPLLLGGSIISSSASFANESWVSYNDDIPVITVRRYPEAASAVPGVVQLIDNKDIEQANITSPSDISALTPGFSFNDPFGRYNPAPSFRGLIQPGLGDDPSVGFFNDGLYLSGRSSINSLAFDLEKIEIAKGPQNALYGRNSFGGAINAVSARPNGDFGMWFDGRAGTHDRFEAETGVNVPLTETLNSRLALYWRDWGGYFDNKVPGGPDIGREQTKAARLSFDFTPNSSRSIITRFTHIEDEDGQPKGFLVPANCGPRIADGQNRLFCGEIPERATSYAANDVGTEQPMGYNRSHTRGTLEWEERFASDLTWTSLFGGSIEDSVFIRDDDYQAVNASRAGIDTDRFDLQFDSRVNMGTNTTDWQGLLGVSGYHFFNKVNRIDQNYVLGAVRPGGARVKNSTDTLGTYASLTRRWNNGFALTGDARWQWEQKDLRTDTRAITTGQPIALDDSWTAFTPKLTGSWTSDQNILYYASITRGYKTGGFNDRANILDSERTYDPEENITYELGVKNIPVSDNLSIDLGGFFIDWTDQQVTAYSTAGATQNFFINNAGQTEVKGLEAAAHWQPLVGLDFDLGYTYALAEYKSYNDPDLATIQGYGGTGDVSGNRLPRYSPHQVSLNTTYRTASPIRNWDTVVGGQFTYESSQYTDNSNTSKTGDRTLLNLQGGIESGNAYIGLWVDNALNEKDPAVGIPWFDASQGFRREWLIVPQDGTTAGVRMKLKW